MSTTSPPLVSGLVNYRGDSEISDSEDEALDRSSVTTPPAVSIHGLGIPPTQAKRAITPPVFVRPVVKSAPSLGLVDYMDEDEDPNESKQVEEEEEEHVEQQYTLHQTTRPHETVSPSLELMSEELETEEEISESCTTRALFLPIHTIQLPPEPTKQCSDALQEKIRVLLEKKNKGLNLNCNLQRRKDIRNPSIYEKLVEFCNLDEFGSNYPVELFDPKGWDEEWYHDNILKAQKKAYEKKQKAKLDRTKIEFVTGTKKPATTSIPPGSSQEGAGTASKKQRRSKWDVVSGGAGGEGSASNTGSRGSSPSAVAKGTALAAPVVGAQAKVQATQMTRDLLKLAKKM